MLVKDLLKFYAGFEHRSFVSNILFDVRFSHDLLLGDFIQHSLVGVSSL